MLVDRFCAYVISTSGVLTNFRPGSNALLKLVSLLNSRTNSVEDNVKHELFHSHVIEA